MLIHIAYKGSDPVGIILAKDVKTADIVFTSMKSGHDRIETLDPNREDVGLHGVVYLLTSTEANSKTDFGHRAGGVDFRIWKRGL